MPDSNGDGTKARELQANIAEGKMMLTVLRSFPSSENTDAFIRLFETLVSRLESHEDNDGRSSNTTDLRAQLDALRNQQEKVLCLLAETAHELQTSSSTDPGPSQKQRQLSLEATDELLSKFKAWLTTEDSNSFGEISKPAENGMVNASPSAHNSVEFSVERSFPDADQTAKPPVRSSWSLQLDPNLARLNNLMEEVGRFEDMVDRLLGITVRAHLNDATGFLREIMARFGELRGSFDSLRGSYETLAGDPQMTDQLKETQLSGFLGLLSKLDRNLESTKECFFTVYHLVKSNIEQGMLDGSLRDVDDEEGEDEQEGQLSTETPTQPISSVTTSLTQTNSTGQAGANGAATRLTTAETYLATQNARLAALRDQTRIEEEEIKRLLQQRDELAERLRTLKAATATATVALQRNLAETSENQSPTGSIHKTSSVNSSHETPLAVLSHLESKRCELEELKAQLQLHERNLAVLDAVKPTDSSFVSENGEIATQSHLNGRISDRGEKTAIPSKLAKPRVAVQNTHTELLYENIREARILLEEQRARGQGSNVAGSLEPGALVNVGHPSVAMSQDQTTLATWGGSSPTAPSSTESCEPVEDNENHAFSVLPSSSPSPVEISNPSAGLHSRPSNVLPRTVLAQSGPCIAKRVGKLPTGSRSNDGTHLSFPGDSVGNGLSMPTLGPSPSPPSRCTCVSGGSHPAKADSVVSGTQTPVRSGDWEANNSAHPDSIHLVSTKQTEERLLHMERSISDLSRICRYLMLENVQLNSTVTQLMWLTGSAKVSEFPHSGLPMSSGSAVPFLSSHPYPNAHPTFSNTTFSPHVGPYPASTFHDSSASRPPPPDFDLTLPRIALSQEQMQAALAHLLQQQKYYFNLQYEFQHMLRQRMENRVPYVANVPMQPMVSPHLFSSQLLSPVSTAIPSAVQSFSTVTDKVRCPAPLITPLQPGLLSGTVPFPATAVPNEPSTPSIMGCYRNWMSSQSPNIGLDQNQALIGSTLSDLLDQMRVPEDTLSN